jgi:hypothetical protein
MPEPLIILSPSTAATIRQGRKTVAAKSEPASLVLVLLLVFDFEDEE